MELIPLVRARYASNFVAALNQHGAPVEKYLLRAHLPLELLEYADGQISAHSLWKFAGDAALDTGIFDIGFLAGATPVAVHGDFGTHVVHAPSLHSAMQTFCDEAHAEYSRADFYLTHDGPTAWFCRGPIDGTPEQQQQIELYVLMLMLQTIQMVLGDGWRSARIRLKYTKASNIADNDFLLAMNIEFGAPFVAIAIPLLSLATQMPIIENNTICTKDSYKPVPFSKLSLTEPLLTLRQLLADYVRYTKHSNIEIAADMAGVSTRTLQRFLQQKGTTYTRLIDQVRFDLAVPLLNNDSISITDIACELGYADIANFSRTFSRITGMSPRTYRHISNISKV